MATDRECAEWFLIGFNVAIWLVVLASLLLESYAP